MKSTTTLKYEEAIAYAEVFIQKMEGMDDHKLSKHLDIFRQQMERAYAQKNEEAVRLIQEYEEQIIQARMRKI
ncbi:MAG: hypothetical protein KA797_06190 [Chitinophagales bacterium]|nr:hypothetical protein [Chitinophagales bacterium]